MPRVLEPWVFVRRMVQHEIDENTNTSLFGAVSELDEVAHCPVSWVNAIVIGHVVAIVAMRRDLEWHEPNGGYAKALQIVEPARQPDEVADTVVIGIHECPNRQAVNNGVLIPKVVNHRVESPIGRHHVNALTRLLVHGLGGSGPGLKFWGHNLTTTPSCERRSMLPDASSPSRSRWVESKSRPRIGPDVKATAVGSLPMLSATRIRASSSSRKKSHASSRA